MLIFSVDLKRSERVKLLRKSKKVRRPSPKRFTVPIKAKILHINADNEVTDLTPTTTKPKVCLVERVI
jgi:hypothetical protein